MHFYRNKNAHLSAKLFSLCRKNILPQFLTKIKDKYKIIVAEDRIDSPPLFIKATNAGIDPAQILSEYMFDRNGKSEHISNLEDCVRIILTWSECRDSNSRPLEPHSFRRKLLLCNFVEHSENQGIFRTFSTDTILYRQISLWFKYRKMIEI